MLHAATQVNGKTIWANTHLLFWLSLIPFASGRMGENHFTKSPVVVYGFVLLMCAVAYAILAKTLAKNHGKGSTIHKAVGKDKKGKVSLLICVTGIGLCFVNLWLGFALYSIVAAI